MKTRLSKRLKELRAEQGITQTTLAKRAKLTLGYIARLETNRHDPQLSTLEKLAKAFRISVSELLR